MSQEYKVEQAFQATVSKEDKTPKTTTINGNTFNIYKVKFEGEGSKGWININKKPGNEVKKGDSLYGDIKEVNGQYGTFYNFSSASRPFGQSAPKAVSNTPVETQSSVSTELIHDKLDYIIGLLEGGKKASVNLEDLDI